jgi:hypothetical protein
MYINKLEYGSCFPLKSKSCTIRYPDLTQLMGIDASQMKSSTKVSLSMIVKEINETSGEETNKLKL